MLNIATKINDIDVTMHIRARELVQVRAFSYKSIIVQRPKHIDHSSDAFEIPSVTPG
jgi:hypothetical protein